MGYRGLAAGEAEFEVALERSAWGEGPWGNSTCKDGMGQECGQTEGTEDPGFSDRLRVLGGSREINQRILVSEACYVGRGPFVPRGQHRVQ